MDGVWAPGLREEGAEEWAPGLRKEGTEEDQQLNTEKRCNKHFHYIVIFVHCCALFRRGIYTIQLWTGSRPIQATDSF